MFADKLKLDYNYVYRIMREQKKGGRKFIVGLIKLCIKEDSDIYDFINVYLTKRVAFFM